MNKETIDGLTAVVWCLIGLVWIAFFIGVVVVGIKEHLEWKRYTRKR